MLHSIYSYNSITNMKLKEKIEQERLALEYMENKLICEDFHFYNNGIIYKNIRTLSPQGWFADLDKVEPSIRIFGTRDQIEEALDTYIEMTGLNLNECFDYDNEEGLKFYKKEYDKLNNNKALITTI